MKSIGHNMYPTDFAVLGPALSDIQYRMRAGWFYDIADEEGILVTVSLPTYIRQEAKSYLESVAYRRELHHLVDNWMSEYGNHACVVKWRAPRGAATSHPNWTNPHYLSGDASMTYAIPYYTMQVEAATMLRKYIKSKDTSGRVINNSGGSYDGLITAYFYPNFGVPIQEVVDWPSRWAANGHAPLILEEGDFTGSCMFYWLNGQEQKGIKKKSANANMAINKPVEVETTQAEQAARFLGEKAYLELDNNYMKMSNNARSQGRDKATNINGLTVYFKSSPVIQVMVEYITRVIPAWRTFGIPEIWHHGVTNQVIQNVVWANGWKPENTSFVDDYSNHGIKCERLYGVLENSVYDRIPNELRENAAVKAYRRVMRPLLIAIGGGPGNNRFTTVEHSYWSSEIINKSVSIINDTNKTILANIDIALINVDIDNGLLLEKSELHAEVQQGKSALIPFSFKLPVVNKRTNLKIVVTSNGEKQSEFDIQAFPVFNELSQGAANRQSGLAIFDISKEATGLIGLCGISGIRLNETSSLDGIKSIIVGRNSLNKEFFELANRLKLQDRIRAGLNVLVFEQSPEKSHPAISGELMKTSCRRAFIRSVDHPAFAGLNENDFRDWRGGSNMMVPFPPCEQTKWTFDYSRFQKWGNEGIVASYVFEKPDSGNYQVLADCGFDLWQTPLVEFRYGSGSVTLCQFDVLHRLQCDPVASILARNLLMDTFRQRSPCDGVMGIIDDEDTERSFRGLDANTKHLKYGDGLDGVRLVAIGSTSRVSRDQGRELIEYVNSGGSLVVFMKPSESDNIPEWIPYNISLRPISYWRGRTVLGSGLLNGIGASDLFLRSEASALEFHILPPMAVKVVDPAVIIELQHGKGKIILYSMPRQSDDGIKDTVIRRSSAKHLRIISTMLTQLGVKVNGNPSFEVTTNTGSLFSRAPVTAEYDPDFHIQW